MTHDHPPRMCPGCNKTNRVTEKSEDGTTVSVRLVGSRWHRYKLMDTPMVGCGNCGHVVHLTKQPSLGCFYVDDHGVPEAA